MTERLGASRARLFCSQIFQVRPTTLIISDNHLIVDNAWWPYMLRIILRSKCTAARVGTSRLRLEPCHFRSINIATDAVGQAEPPRHGLKLRKYQEECVQTVLKSLEEGRRRVGVSLATGSGKTVIFTELIERVPSPTADAIQTLILVHRRELVEQAARHCSNRYPEKTVEIEMGNMRASGRADITVASIQSVISKDRIDKFDPAKFKLILVDEAHHIVASGYLRVLKHFGLQSDTIDAIPALIGVSATLSRHDGLSLGKAIKHIVYHKDYTDMIEENWLSDVLFTTVETKVDMSKVKKTAFGDFNTASLSEAVNTNETNLITVRSWQARAANRKSTLVFCVDVAHVKSLTDTFRQHGVDARFVTGDTDKFVRSETLDDFKNGRFSVLINCGVFTEGTDIPNIDCVLLARPTRSRNLLVQMIGRGMRLHPGKKDCHVIDMVASLDSGIVTTPTLFGLDPDEMVHQVDPSSMRKLKDHKEREQRRKEHNTEPLQEKCLAQPTSTDKLTFRDYDSVSDLIDETSGERFIRAVSPNAWVNVGIDRFVLTDGPTGNYLTLEKPSEKGYHVLLTQKLPTEAQSRSPYARPRIVVQAETFESAVRGADTYASKRFTRAFIVNYGPLARWREGPASDAQVAYLNKFRDDSDQLEPGSVSKGKAGDMITKIKFGAKGRFNKIISSKRKQGQALKKEEDLRQQRENAIVRVGAVRG